MSEEELEGPFNMKCRRGSDQMTTGQTCDSMFVEKLTADGKHDQLYRCVKCKFSWSVSLGGSFVLQK